MTPKDTLTAVSKQVHDLAEAPRVARKFQTVWVISIVGRYLEHPRMFYFQNCGEPVYLWASTDLMPRNLGRRVEIALPVLDLGLKTRLKQI